MPVQTEVLPWVNSNCPQEQKRLIRLRIRSECYLRMYHEIQCSMFNSSRYLFTFTGTKIQYDDVHQMLVKLLKPRPGQVLINQHQSAVIWWRDGLHGKHLSCDGAPITLCFQYLADRRIKARFQIVQESFENWLKSVDKEIWAVLCCRFRFTLWSSPRQTVRPLWLYLENYVKLNRLDGVENRIPICLRVCR